AGRTAAGVIPAHVATLAAGVTRAMFLTKAKIATVVFIAAGLFLGGTGTLTYQRLAGDEVLPAASKKSESSAPRKEIRSRAPADNAAKEIVTFRGRILDPDGQPFAGAKLYLLDFARKAGPKKLPVSS